ncbi:MAG TPA: double-strand break repair protein AddB [Xanthobacteraceae bacterium]|jgi:ATP-dependent helicase/nuclease subunit B
MVHTPRIFTIPASTPFLPTLIRALLDGTLVPGFAPAHSRDPLALAGATIYLPTRRACRAARDMFLDVSGMEAAILPRIVPIGDVDEDEILFDQAASGGLAAEALDLPESLELRPALGGLERRLLLARLVLAWAGKLAPPHAGEAPLIANHPATALALADDLGRLIDDMTTRGVSWDRLDDLVPDHFDKYWQLTLAFLKIARSAWPAILAERGMIEAAVRRDALIKAEAARLVRSPGPVIAAGSTGSIPATAELVAAVAKLAGGAVVLPGLDTDLDEESWTLIAGRKGAQVSGQMSGHGAAAPVAGHPQFALQALLARLGIGRDAVIALAEPAGGGRERLASEAFRPAAATDLWRARTGESGFVMHAQAALEGLSCIEAANAEEEALAIAIALREVLAEHDKTAALVTPDRTLARRVLAALARWNVAVDDSGGDRLADTPAGLFARLAAQAAIGGLAPIDLLALLKHPLTRLGALEGAHRHAIAALERAILRGPRPRPGSAGLARALAALRAELGKLKRGEGSDLHRSDPRADLHESELSDAAALIVRLEAALAPLEGLARGPHSFAAIAARHREIVAALSAERDGTAAAFAGPDGNALAQVFDAIAAGLPAADLDVAFTDYAELFGAAITDRVVRRPGLPGVRVRILGPLEARLTTSDRLVLGGLNEGTWPPEARSDAWLSRPMRLELGLDLPERRIGLSAHDFAQMLGAREVILTRAAKLAGTPTVASRFVQRLAAVAGPRWQTALQQGERYLAWARELDRPGAPPRPAPRPVPRPPTAARPTRLSVTEIEHWLRDPYTIYAKHVLRLFPLDPIDTAPGAADRGTVIHGAIGDFTQAYAKALPADALGELLALGRKHFAPLDEFPEARAFWWPRFERIARWFADWESKRRADVAAVQAEIRGEIEIPLGQRSFHLSARADRIERLGDGSYAILDYKTGQVPTGRQVAAGLSPQLTLEAAILRAGRFADIAPGASIAALIYVSLKGGDPGGKENWIEFKDSTPDAEADRALQKLAEVARKFEDQATPYRSRERPMWQGRAYGDYDHLARVKEWSPSGGAGDETEAGDDGTA